jgi:hypothetical protein
MGVANMKGKRKLDWNLIEEVKLEQKEGKNKKVVKLD